MTTETGILGFGVSIPRRELTNAATFEAWDRSAIKGARRIAGPDEDALTLGLSAAFDALNDLDPDTVDGLIFATTTSPYKEKSSAAVIAEALNINASAKVVEISASARCATQAIQIAIDFLSSGSCSNVLVVSADTRIPKPGAMDEFLFGHAGVALLLGAAESAIATITHSINLSGTHTDSWLGATGNYSENADLRFSREHYQNTMQATFEQLINDAGLQATDINKMVIWSPDPKAGMGFLKGNGFDIQSQYCDDVSFKCGLTGAAHSLLMLIGALERAGIDEKIVALNYGDGCDAMAITVNNAGSTKKLLSAIKQKITISYNHYLTINDLHVDGADEYNPSSSSFVSHIMESRNTNLWRKLIAKQCNACQTVMTLPVPTCSVCGADRFNDFQLSRQGSVFAITHEHYFPSKESPLGMATVELSGGGRVTLQIADENPALVNDEKVELVFRRLYTRDGTPHYFWKCRTRGEDS